MILEQFTKIDALLSDHVAFISEISNEIKNLKKDDAYVQNDALREQLANATQRLQENTESLMAMKAENARLKNELYEQLFNEKTKLLNIADGRLNAYFTASAEKEQNRLSQLEVRMKSDIDQMTAQLQQNRVEEENIIYQSLQELREQVDTQVLAARQKAECAHQEILAQKEAGIANLLEEPLTESQMLRRAKQNNLESFLGLKILNKLGILLIVIGVIAAGQFTYVHIADTLKAVLAYALGLAMLVSGELLNRKSPNVFSLGLTAGGIAVLYSATALSFFFLNILSMYPALALCVLITAAAFLLSQRYNAQTIAAFAIVGGYLPIFSIEGSESLVYYAIGYFVLLNTFSLLVSIYKKWRISQYIGFAMNVVSVFYILFILQNVFTTSATVFAIMYTFLGFMVYNALPLVSTYRTGLKLTRADNVLLILNTVISSGAMFLVFFMFDLWETSGLLAIGFGVIYLLTAVVIQKKLLAETTCQALFYITGLAYAVLVIPLQLDAAYLSLGWLIEGTLLLCYGIWTEKKVFKKAGGIISALCLFVFLCFDVLEGGYLFFYKYLFITLASILVLAALIIKGRAVKKGGLIYKCIVVVNLWLFLLYTVFQKVSPWLGDALNDYRLGEYFARVFALAICFCYAYTLARLKPVADKTLRIISLVIYALSILNMLGINTTHNFVYSFGYPAGIVVAGTMTILVINFLAVFAARDFILQLTLGRKLGAEWYPLILSAFFVFVTMQNLIVIFELSLNNVLITGILAATALGWIIFGFVRRYHYIRLFGLGLAFVTVIKLFLIDLNILSTGMRIVSYFMLGFTLLAISFVYQYFNKKLDAPKEGEQP